MTQRFLQGFYGGHVFQHISERSLGIRIELNVVQAGWKEQSNLAKSNTRRLNCLQLPFLTHLLVGKGRTKAIINLGPQISYLLSEKETIPEDAERLKRNYDQVSIENKAEFGLSVGSGLSIDVSNVVFQLEGRFHQGLSHLFKTNANHELISSQSQRMEIALIFLFDWKRYAN